MKKVIVIGGGVSGLSAGIYLKANGYDVELIEKKIFPSLVELLLGIFVIGQLA